MSEPIIIETPAPPTRERLVLVRERVIVPESRDATPADLERAGWVALSPGELVMSAPAFRELKLRAEGREASVARAEKAEREREEARARNDERLRSGGVANYVADLRAEVDTLRAELARLTAVGEGEPTDDELYRLWHQPGTVREQRRRIFRAGVAHERARASAFLLREAADYDADGTTTCSGMALRQAAADLGGDQQSAPAFVQATGTHTFGGRPRTGQGLPPNAQPAQDRATDEELTALARMEWDSPGSSSRTLTALLRAVALAIAARVRQERCLVAQAAGMGAGFSAEPGEGSYGVVVLGSAPPPPEGMPSLSMQAYRKRIEAHDVPTADVPATLARLLGEVSRG